MASLWLYANLRSEVTPDNYLVPVAITGTVLDIKILSTVMDTT